VEGIACVPSPSLPNSDHPRGRRAQTAARAPGWMARAACGGTVDMKGGDDHDARAGRASQGMRSRGALHTLLFDATGDAAALSVPPALWRTAQEGVPKDHQGDSNHQ